MNKGVIQHVRRWSDRILVLAVALATSTLAAGCVEAGGFSTPNSIPSASSSPSVQASADATASVAVSPTAAAVSPTAAANATAAPLPAGTWTGIKWIAAGAAFPQSPAADPGTDSSVTADVYGWSRGYVGFRSAGDMSGDPNVAHSLTSTSSSDGLHWTAVRAMKLDDLKYASLVRITQVAEGPAGLVAIGRYGGMTCGGPPTVQAIWTSTDGATWTRVALSADFLSSAVNTISGGPTGYIASGILKDGLTPAVWLSNNGASWRQTPLPKATFGSVLVDGATSFGAGYVLGGSVRGDAVCGGFNTLTPSLWWSADGTAWSRSKLTGATPASNSWMAVTRISDHSLMAIATEWNEVTQVTSQKVWVSGDGRTWNAVSSPSILLDSGILSDGRRGIIVAIPQQTEGPPSIATVGDDLTATWLGRSGDAPSLSTSTGQYSKALGPAGVVILSPDGSSLWLGVPTDS
jgi:hypothetical protein